MRVHTLLLGPVFVVALLFVQSSGLHTHASVDGVADLHGTHFHEIGIDQHDHEGDSDRSLFDLGVNPLKNFMFIATLALGLTLALRADRNWVPITLHARPRGHVRWRPPLRAPPSQIS